MSAAFCQHGGTIELSLAPEKPYFAMSTATVQRTVRPIGDRVLVQRIDPEEVTKGGIIIPDSAKEKPQEAKVLTLGTGARDDDGQPIPFQVKKGDRILISKYGGTEVKLDDESYLIIRESDILAVIN